MDFAFIFLLTSVLPPGDILFLVLLHPSIELGFPGHFSSTVELLPSLHWRTIIDQQVEKKTMITDFICESK